MYDTLCKFIFVCVDIIDLNNKLKFQNLYKINVYILHLITYNNNKNNNKNNNNNNNNSFKLNLFLFYFNF